MCGGALMPVTASSGIPSPGMSGDLPHCGCRAGYLFEGSTDTLADELMDARRDACDSSAIFFLYSSPLSMPLPASLSTFGDPAPEGEALSANRVDWSRLRPDLPSWPVGNQGDSGRAGDSCGLATPTPMDIRCEDIDEMCAAGPLPPTNITFAPSWPSVGTKVKVDLSPACVALRAGGGRFFPWLEVFSAGALESLSKGSEPSGKKPLPSCNDACFCFDLDLFVSLCCPLGRYPASGDASLSIGEPESCGCSRRRAESSSSCAVPSCCRRCRFPSRLRGFSADPSPCFLW
mmetsp:Transcript_62073/g.148069  ORF Transcript_62073/g.148069 Transcript_62073/m.148069 type:complete len:290 (-) Transcript_62073:1153-2022(-)